MWSPGGGGSVSQTNSASSAANAGNDAQTWQNANQGIGGKRIGCECHTLPIQAIGQKAWTAQFGLAGSGAFQLYPGNVSDPLRIKSPDGKEKPKDHGSDGKGSHPCGCSDGKGSYPDAEGLVSGREGLVSGREGLVSGREGLVSGREGLVSGREGLVSGREGARIPPVRARIPTEGLVPGGTWDGRMVEPDGGSTTQQDTDGSTATWEP